MLWSNWIAAARAEAAGGVQAGGKQGYTEASSVSQGRKNPKRKNQKPIRKSVSWSVAKTMYKQNDEIMIRLDAHTIVI
jgi:hypothetical protein